MKRILALTLAVLCLLALAACAPRESGPVKTSSTIVTTVISDPNEAFYVSFCGEYLVPGQVFPKQWLVAPNFSMPPENGQDGIYTYSYIKVTSYIKDGQEYIRSIVIDTNRSASTPTADGLLPGDDVTVVEQIYGKAAQKTDNAWTYRKGNTLLILQLENEKVTGIEYHEA